MELILSVRTIPWIQNKTNKWWAQLSTNHKNRCWIVEKCCRFCHLNAFYKHHSIKTTSWMHTLQRLSLFFQKSNEMDRRANSDRGIDICFLTNGRQKNRNWIAVCFICKSLHSHSIITDVLDIFCFCVNARKNIMYEQGPNLCRKSFSYLESVDYFWT